MLFFHACPKCRTGVVEFSSDTFGAYLQCLNCGLTVNMEPDENPATVLKQTQERYAAARRLRTTERAISA